MTEPADNLRCPRCQLLMRPEEYESHNVMFCSTCWGYWLDAQTLQAILDEHQYKFSKGERSTLMALMEGVGDVDREGQEAELINCPQCDRQMVRKKWIDGCPVEVDQCPDHGIWLDTGEIKELQIFAESRE